MPDLGSFVVRHRKAILAISGILLVAAGAALPRLEVDAGARNLLFVDPDVRQTFERYEKEWGGDRFLAVTFEFQNGDLFTAKRLRFLRDMTHRLRHLAGVQRVESLTSVTLPTAQGEALRVGPLVPRPVPTTPTALARLRQQAMQSTLLRRVLLDDTGTLAAINVWLKHSDDDVQVVIRTTRRIERLVHAPGLPGVRARVIGGPVVVAAVFAITKRDVLILSLAPFLLVALLLYGVTRSLRGVLLPLLCVAASGLGTFGVMAATGTRINLVTSMLPTLIMVISVSDVIHLLVQHQEARRAGLDGDDAVRWALRRAALPCTLTSLTTAVGFGSLVLADVPQVREFGIFAAVGIGLALGFALLTVPATLAVLKPVARPPQPHGRFDRALGRMGAFGQRHPLPVLAVSLGVVVVSVLGIHRLQVESSALRFLPEDHPVLRDLHAVEPRLMGTMALMIHVYDRTPWAGQTRAASPSPRPTPPTAGDEVIEDPEDRPPTPVAARRSTGREALRQPRVLTALDGLVRHLQGVPGVRKVLSITEYLKEANRTLSGGRTRALPTDPALVASLLDVAEGRDPTTLHRLINFERSAANVTVMCIAHSSAAMRRIMHATRAYLARPAVHRVLGQQVAAELTGYAPLLAHVSDRIVATQLKSCFVALAVIGAMLILVLWSVRGGLLALLPNILPIALTVGLMGFTGITLNITTVMIASVALGIAVDDTIHVLVHYRRELASGRAPEVAMRHTLETVGRALVYTSVVITGGFLILLLATLSPARQFGALTAVTMATALLADLVLLPALVGRTGLWRAHAPAPDSSSPRHEEAP